MQFKKSLLLWCVRFRSFECHGLSDLQTAVAVASAAVAAVVVAVAAVVDAVVVWPTVSASPAFAASSTARHFLACRRTRQRRLRSKCLAMAQLCRGRLELNVKFKMLFFTKKWPFPAPFSFSFGLFKHQYNFYTTNKCEK